MWHLRQSPPDHISHCLSSHISHPQHVRGLLFYDLGPRSYAARNFPGRAQNHLYKRSSIKFSHDNDAQQFETKIGSSRVALDPTTISDAPFRPVDPYVPVGIHPVRVLRMDEWGAEERS